jgi:hypothetical protein
MKQSVAIGIVQVPPVYLDAEKITDHRFSLFIFPLTKSDNLLGTGKSNENKTKRLGES